MAVPLLTTFLGAFPYTVTNYYDMSTTTAAGLNSIISTDPFWSSSALHLVGETQHICLLYKDLGTSIKFYVYLHWLDQTYGGNCQGCFAQLYIDGNYKRVETSTSQSKSGDFSSTYSKTNMSVEIRAGYYHCDINNGTRTWEINENLGPINLSFDSIAPTITGPTYPSSEVSEVSGQTYAKGSTVTVTYTASDTGGSGLAGIWIDGSQASSSGSASKTYTVTADFTSQAYSRDGAGNQSGTVSKVFKFDNIPPTISNFIVNSATTPVSGQDFFVDYPNTTCDFEFTATDNESGLKSYKATNASGTDTTGSLSGTSQTITLSHDLNEANSSNEIKYELEVEDIAGNISTQSSPIVIVDNTPPTGTLAIDSSQTINDVDGVTYIKTSDVKLSITKSDSESGLF